LKLFACELNDFLLALLLGSGSRSSDEQEEDLSSLPGRGLGIGEGILLNEWGALLLYDQLTTLVNLLEDTALALLDESLKSSFAVLLWSLKIFTLDRPGDIRRGDLLPSSEERTGLDGVGAREVGREGRMWPTRFPGDCGWYRIRQSDVKRFLRRRVDFSRDVISKLKL
jgi:hypothetical protein